MIRGLGNVTDEDRLEEQGLFSVEKKKLWGKLANNFQIQIDLL